MTLRAVKTTHLHCGCRKLAIRQDYLGNIIMPMETFVDQTCMYPKAGHDGFQCVMTTNFLTIGQ